MDTEQRKRIVEQKLRELGVTLSAWAKETGLSQRIVTDLIDGKLKGTRGVSLETRRRMEEVFGDIF